jgi:transglutaminase-like putative cysteine protease
MRHIAERPNWRPEVETAPLAQVGRRVGATALGLALVVPAVLPDLSGASFGLGGGLGFGSGGGGGNRIAVINPILDLGKNLRRAEDRVVIQYAGRPTYLRLVGADEFTGEQWRPSELQVSRDDNNVEDGLRRPPGLGTDVATTGRRYRIEVGELEQNWLPLPYPAQRVQIDGTWLYDESTFNVFGENASTRKLTYEVRALDVRPTPEQLRNAPEAPDSMGRYLQLPDGLPGAVALEASRVVKGLPTAYDQALALQDWLRSPEFTYSTEVSDTIGDGNGSAAILRFLETRAGYCVHFASTMAVMARLLDIPARVAVGFTRGSPTGDGSWLVGLHDAHAWPELFFQGVGWVAFEPTPGERTGDPPPWARADAAGGGTTPDPQSTSQPTTGASPGPQNPRATEGRQDILEELGSDGGGGAGAIGAGPVQIPVVPLLIGLGVLVLLSVPAATRAVVRRRRWAAATTSAERARAAWADLQDTLVDHGYDWQASDSPRTGVARLVHARELDADAAEAGRRLAGATEQARYAPVMRETDGDLRADVEAVRAGLAATASRWGRWRARLLPRSTRAVSAAMGERLADGLDAVDAGVASVTGRLKLRG